MSDLRYWLWLSNLSGLTPRAALRYLQAFPTIKELYLAGEPELRQIEGAHPNEVHALCRKDIHIAEEIEANCRALGVQVLCLRDAAYPDRLRNIDDPPLVIYVKGKLPPVDDRLCIAIVGTRKCTSYGKETAGRIAGELASQGAVIVTGLAEGIDSAAAKGAMNGHGSVIGVLGTGVDVVYPAWNTQLQTAVGQIGALVSEYPPGTKATRYAFPRRNRIISGLSLGVTIVQAPQRSGSLITAARAQEQGRDVFVVPGSVEDPSFRGSNDLIRDGAQLIRGGADILEEYRFRYPELLRQHRPDAADASIRAAKDTLDKEDTLYYSSLTEQLNSLTEAELAIVGVLSQGVCYADEVIRRSGMSAGAGMAALTMLQLKGYIREDGGRYRLLVQYQDPAAAEV